MNMTSVLRRQRTYEDTAATTSGTAAAAFSKGLLMGARGNSGVILSQLFRGFSKSLGDSGKANMEQIAGALQQGVDTAYQAVVEACGRNDSDRIAGTAQIRGSM